MTKRIVIALILVSLASLAAEKQLGKQFTLQSQTAIADLLKTPDQFVEKTVQVKGRITEVCEMAGCWTNLVDPSTNKMIKVKVNDGEIVFPKDGVGKMAIAEGTFKKYSLTKEQAIARAQHEAEEQGKKFNPASVKSGTTIYQIAGTGAIVLE